MQHIVGCPEPPAELRICKWAGTVLQIAGAFLLATRLAPPPLAYIIMLLGSVAWTWAGCMMRDRSIIAMNGAFTVFNLIGLIRWAQP